MNRQCYAIKPYWEAYEGALRQQFDTFITLRYDIGAVWEGELLIQAKDFINGRGLALSLKTPLGPFSIAYGQTSTRDERLYISAGYNF